MFATHPHGHPLFACLPVECLQVRALRGHRLIADHLILANFLLADQQIDFVLVIAAGASLIELKNFSRAVFGERNGVWEYLDASGTKVRSDGNPVSPEAEVRAERRHAEVPAQHRRVPPALGPHFYADFAAYVCIAPEIAAGSRVTKGEHDDDVDAFTQLLVRWQRPRMSHEQIATCLRAGRDPGRWRRPVF